MAVDIFGVVQRRDATELEELVTANPSALQLTTDYKYIDGCALVQDRWLPIHIVCAMGDIDLLKIITNFGRENLCVKTPHNAILPFHLASFSGNVSVLEFLYEIDSSVLHTKDQIGRTALHYACRGNNEAAIRWLQQRGLNLNERDKRGYSPLLTACICGYPVAIDCLIRLNCSTDITNNYGDTPFHIAVKSRYTSNEVKGKVIDSLMKHDVTANKANKEGKLPHEFVYGELRGQVQAYAKSQRLAPLFETGVVRPNTVKVYLIGSTMAGKTTFVSILTGEGDPFNVLERTPGIDIFELTTEQVAHLKLFDVAGHDLFHTTHSFFFGGASVLFVYIVDTERSLAEMEEDAMHWLAFVYSGRPPDSPTPYVLVLGSRGEKGRTRQIKLESLMKTIRRRFGDRFIFIGEPKALDLRQANSQVMQNVKTMLFAGAQRCLECVPDVPLVCHNIRETVLPMLREEQRLSHAEPASFPCGHFFIEREAFQTMVQKICALLQDSEMYALTEQYLCDSAELVDGGRHLVTNTLWLCRYIMGPIISSRACKDSEEFQIRMEAMPDGTAFLENVADALDRFSLLYGTPAVNASAAVEILCYMGLTLRLPTENRFLFPALIQEDKPLTVWTPPEENTGMVYAGIRLQCQFDIEIISPAVMPLLQCEAAQRRDEMHVILWNGGLYAVEVGDHVDPTVEAVVCVSDKKRAIRALDITARGPPHFQHDVKKFLDKLEKMTMRIVDAKCPGTRIEKQFLSHQHITRHTQRPIAHSLNDIRAAKRHNGVVMKTTNTETVKDSVVDLLAVDDDHIVYKLQSLGKHCRGKWLEFGRVLLNSTPDQVRDVVAHLGRDATMMDRFCHVMEVWMKTNWRGATLDTFLQACDRVGDGLKGNVLRELGLDNDPHYSHSHRRSSLPEECCKSPVKKRREERGSFQMEMEPNDSHHLATLSISAMSNMAASKLSPKQIVAVACQVTDKWVQFAAVLAPGIFTIAAIDVIVRKYRDDPFQQARAMLEAWSNDMHKQASCRTVISTFLQMKLKAKACEVFGDELVEFVSQNR